ncbi:hypothetical protein N9J67_03020, partial [Schleiferiaceae bacterium]|nr:hypothetical protein [Schleiferiaceae bacterium]
MSKITVEPNYSYTNTLAVRDSVRTLNGMDILQHSRSFRPGFLDDQIFLARGAYYNNSELRSTFKNLTALGVFKNIELDIKDLDSTLTARIKLVPLPKRAVTAAIEGLGNNGSLGIGGNFSWDNRNLFKGGELLRLSIGGSVTEQRNSTNNTWLIDARELNSSATLRIPKLLLPGAWIPIKSKKWSPRTEIISKVSYQFRANEFNRLNLTNRLDYHWKIGKTKHTLTPAQLSLIRIDLNAISQSTPFLFVGFQDLVFASTALNILRETVMGRELFDYAFKEYSRRWAFKHPSPADFFRTMEDASAVDLDWFWRGWFYTTDHVDIAMTDVKWYQMSSKNPDVENPIKEDQFLKADAHVGKSRNSVIRTVVDEVPASRDFYNAYNQFDVSDADREEYQQYRSRLSPDEAAMLDAGYHFYGISFENKGGLLMPLVLRFTLEDGTQEIKRVPVEVWVKHEESFTKWFNFSQPVVQITLDPFLEMADTDRRNNYWPAQVEPSKFDVYSKN